MNHIERFANDIKDVLNMEIYETYVDIQHIENKGEVKAAIVIVEDNDKITPLIYIENHMYELDENPFIAAMEVLDILYESKEGHLQENSIINIDHTIMYGFRVIDCKKLSLEDNKFVISKMFN